MPGGTLLQKESTLALSFSRDELDRYVTYRTSGLAEKSRDWTNRSSKLLWDCTKGAISHHTVETLRERTLEEYTSTDSHSKVLNFARSFLKFLGTTHAARRVDGEITRIVHESPMPTTWKGVLQVPLVVALQFFQVTYALATEMMREVVCIIDRKGMPQRQERGK